MNKLKLLYPDIPIAELATNVAGAMEEKSKDLPKKKRRDYYSTEYAAHSVALIAHSIITKTRKSVPCRFHSHALQKLGKPHYTAFKTMEALGYVRRVKEYSKGRFSREYELSGPFEGIDIHNCELNPYIIEDEVFIKKFCKAVFKDPEQWEGIATLDGIEIRMDDVHEILGEKLATGDIDKNTAGLALKAAQTIQNGEFFAKKDTFSGRVHTNLTNLPGYLRKALRWKGDDTPLANVDVKNSQPQCLAMLMKKDSRDKFLAMNPEKFAWSAVFEQFSECEGLNEFIKVAESGHLYEDMQGKLAEIGYRIDREQAKKLSIMWLFVGRQGNSWLFNDKLKDYNNMVGTHYSAVKVAVNRIRVMASDMAEMAKMLQSAEVCVILDTFAKEAYDKGYKYATIHDSALCKQKDAEAIKGLMLGAYRQFNANATVDITYYQPVDTDCHKNNDAYLEFLDDYEQNNWHYESLFLWKTLGLKKLKPNYKVFSDETYRKSINGHCAWDSFIMNG